MAEPTDSFKYPRILTKRLNGSEEFKHEAPIEKLTVQDYWAWAHSALSANIERGIVAEFLVAAALGVARDNHVRDPWADSDVIVPDGITPNGMLHIEVKSGSYIQDWDQQDLSKIKFSRLRGHAAAVDGSGILEGMRGPSGERSYKSHVYVLSVLKHKEQDSLNILDISQWDFYILSRAEVIALSGEGESLTLKKVERDFEVTPYAELAKQIHLKYLDWRGNPA